MQYPAPRYGTRITAFTLRPCLAAVPSEIHFMQAFCYCPPDGTAKLAQRMGHKLRTSFQPVKPSACCELKVLTHAHYLLAEQHTEFGGHVHLTMHFNKQAHSWYSLLPLILLPTTIRRTFVRPMLTNYTLKLAPRNAAICIVQQL